LVRENGSGGPCSSSLHKIQITSRIHPRIRVSSVNRASLLVCLLFLSLEDTSEEVKSYEFHHLTSRQWPVVSLIPLYISRSRNKCRSIAELPIGEKESGQRLQATPVEIRRSGEEYRGETRRKGHEEDTGPSTLGHSEALERGIGFKHSLARPNCGDIHSYLT
jgi:hypothetical protein